MNLLLISLLVIINIFGVFGVGSKYVKENCDRVRRPMHELTEDELMLYVEGLQEIRRNGKYQIMADAHAGHTLIHRGSSFFFYHTYFVWEVETQIRALGGKFECFSLPYYDWTIDAGRELNPWILNSVFGGDGDINNHHCVTGELWSVKNWATHELCADTEDPDDGGCCLKRSLGRGILLSTAHKTGGIVLNAEEFRQFEGGIAKKHQLVHWLFAKEECISCAMATGYSPDDPIFMLLHSFVAYLRAVWASCHGHNKILAEDLQDHPEAYTAECADGFDDCDVIELDDAYLFDNMANQEWSITSQIDVTPRMLWDFKDWGVKYDLGSFYEESGIADSHRCPDFNIYHNNDWFDHSFSGRGGINVDEYNQEKEEIVQQEQVFANDNNGLANIGNGWNVSPFLFLCLILSMIFACVKYIKSTNSKANQYKKLINKNDEIEQVSYDSIA